MSKRKLILIFILCAMAAIAVAAVAGCKNKAEKYTVTFVTNGGSEVAPLELEAGETIVPPADPEREYYTFNWWCGDEALTSKYTFGVMPAQDITLYAKWTPDKAVKIEFVSNGGTAVDDLVAAVGAQITEPQSPVRAGYKFGGWYKDEALTEYFAFNVAPADNLVLYARWLRDDGYNYVTFSVNGRDYSVAAVTSGQTVAQPALDGSLAVEGWYSDSSYNTPFDFSAQITDDAHVFGVAYTRGLVISDGVVTGYSGTSEAVVIPEIYGGVKVAAVGEKAFFNNSSITSVLLPQTVTAIGAYAFYNCAYINTINLSSEIKTIGDYAFYYNKRLVSFGELGGIDGIGEGVFLGCSKITEVQIPYGVDKIGDYAFADCSALSSLAVPDTVSQIGDYAFSGCSSLVTFNIPRSLTSLGNGALADCKSLNSVTVASGNAKYSVVDKNLYTDMGKTLVLYLQADKTDTVYTTRNETKILEGAFANNSALTSIVIGDNVTEIERGALKDMLSLQTLTVPLLGDGDENVFLAYLFGASTALENGTTSVYVPTTLYKVTVTGDVTSVPSYAFYGCTGLKEIEGIENATSFGTYAFSYTGLESFTISALVTSVGETSTGENAFTSCSALEEINVDADNAKYASYDGCLYDKSLTTLYSVPVSKTSVTFPSGVATISGYAFTNSRITDVTVPSTVTKIGYKAFYNCVYLTHMSVPFIGSSATENSYMLYVFGGYYTESAEGKVTFSNTSAYPSLLTTIDYTGEADIPDFAFAYCQQLQRVNYGDSVTSIGKYAFYHTSVSAFELGAGVTSVGDYAFAYLDSLTGDITVPGRLTHMGDGIFGYDRNITSITFEEGITEISTGACVSYIAADSGTGKYYYYSKLTEINIPASCVKIGGAAFSGAGYDYVSDAQVYYEVKVNFAAGSKLEEIGSGAFETSGIKNIVIPASVTTVGSLAFVYCEQLESVTFGSEEEGSNLQEIGGASLGYCKSIESLTIWKNVAGEEDVPEIVLYALTNGSTANIFYGSAKPVIYVKGADIYKEAAEWVDYASYIYEIQ